MYVYKCPSSQPASSGNRYVYVHTSYCENTSIPLIAGPLREQLRTQENEGTRVHASCTLTPTLPLHPQPLRKLHLKEETGSGGRLPTASLPLPFPPLPPSSAPLEASNTAAWPEQAGLHPVSSSTSSCPGLPHQPFPHL